jgi:hypothetical protein
MITIFSKNVRQLLVDTSEYIEYLMELCKVNFLTKSPKAGKAIFIAFPGLSTGQDL